MIEEIESWLALGWEVLAFLVVIFYLKGIIKAFKGGNGVWQIDEISKLGIFLLLYYMVSSDAGRQHEWMFFPLTLYVLLIFAILVMAKMENVIKYFLDFMKIWKGKQDE